MADEAAGPSGHGTVSETTPLLPPNGEPADAESQEQTRGADFPTAADKTTPVVIATWLELIAGSLCVFFGVASAIIRSASPEGFRFPWIITNIIPGAIFLAVVAIFFAIFNLIQLRRVNKTLPVPLNLVVDLIVAFFLLSLTGQAWDSVSFDCSAGYRDKLPDDVLHHCLEFGHLVMPILWLIVILSGVVGFTALFLFIARSILLFQRRRPLNLAWGQWRLPVGQLTVEFTIKLLPDRTMQGASAAVDHGETSGA